LQTVVSVEARWSVAQRVAEAVGVQPAGYEPIGYQSLGYRLKRALLGRPLPTSRLVHERLRKLVALAVFSSDAISSTAYGTEQIMLVLVAAGAAATSLALPIALGIGALLTILILSYRQTITAYPSAGGAYIVTKDNFGPRLAQVAGSALLIDYVLTVSVSVTSGVAAVTTAVPPLQRFILPLSLVAIALIAWANLTGVRESGRIFAVPTYLFVGSCALMLLVGLGRQLTGQLPPIPAGQTAPLPPQTATVGLLLVLHAFASGCTALTGVEAISNGVPAFRRPEAQNARRTLIAMGAILGTLFVGVSYLAVHTHVRPYDSGNPTLIGQLASWVLGTSPAGRVFFYLFQAATLAILVLAGRGPRPPRWDPAARPRSPARAGGTAAGDLRAGVGGPAAARPARLAHRGGRWPRGADPARVRHRHSRAGRPDNAGAHWPAPDRRRPAGPQSLHRPTRRRTREPPTEPGGRRRGPAGRGQRAPHGPFGRRLP
jgi:hypothetical protein